MPPVQRTQSLEEVLIARDASPKAQGLSAGAPPQFGVNGAHFSNPLYDRCGSVARRHARLYAVSHHVARGDSLLLTCA